MGYQAKAWRKMCCGLFPGRALWSPHQLSENHWEHAVEGNETNLKNIKEKTEISLYIFSTFMEYRTLSNIWMEEVLSHQTETGITEEHKISQQSNNLRNLHSKSLILNLNREEGNSWMLLGFPWNRTTTKKENITINRLTTR